MSSAGIFGGNFDPVHVGHLITANRVLESRKLEKIIFVPAYISPFKTEIKSSPAQDRLNMLSIALQVNEQFIYDDYEIKKEGVSYSINTLRHFKKEYDQLDLIIGMDNLVEFTSWKDPDEILQLCNLVVLRRTPIKSEHKTNRFFDKAVFIDSPLLEISSTDIRKRIKENKSVDFLIPEGVKEYILNNNLYRE